MSATLMPLSLVSPEIFSARAQSPEDSQFTLQADTQAADPDSGMITARGNVLFLYPRYQIEGTAEEAQYFVAESKLVLMGNAQVTQQGEMISSRQITCLLGTGQCQPTSDEIAP